MRAVTVPHFGEADVLTVREVAAPEPASGQVAIDVTHAAVGLADVLMRRGEFGGTTPLIPGLEVAGTVRSVGAGVATLEPGQAVVTLSRPTAGGYAEVSVADAAITFAIDSPAARLGSALAVAGVPNTTTALIVLERVAHMQQGERVLVHGAAGGLASMVGQVARALGAGQVIGSVRSDDAASVARRYGYDTIVDGRRLIASLEEHDVDSVDVVVDPVGGELRAQSMGLLAPLGRLVAVGNASGADDVTIGANDAWLTNRAVLGLNIGGLLMAHPDFADASAHRAIQLLSAGDVTIDHATLPLDEAVQAHRRLEAGGLTSRILLAP